MNGTISLQSKLKGAVSMANTIINGGASPYPKTVGPAAIASFSDGAQDAPLKSLVFDIEPVQSGSGDPSPTNIRPISGWTQVNAWQTGGNLFNYDAWKTVGLTRCTAVFENNGVTLTATGTDAYTNFSTAFPADARISVKVGEPITLSWDTPDTAVAAQVYIFPNGATVGLVSTPAVTKKLTYTPTAGITYVTFRLGVTTNGATVHYKNLMANFGTAAASYTPFTGMRAITIPLGRTVYGGYVDVVRGKLVIDSELKTLTGNNSWQESTGAYGYVLYNVLATSQSRAPYISNLFKTLSASDPYSQTGIFFGQNNRHIYVTSANNISGVTDLASFKAYLNSNNLQIVIPLATPIEVDLTPQTIKTLLGTNNIWADSGDTTLEYYPAAASIVSVLNRSSKVYTSIPLGKIRYETYQITPQQTIDLDSYRSENGNLLRNPVATKCKIEFNTPLMTDSEWADVWRIIKAGFNNNTERKLKLRYYDTLSATYKTGYFYVPDVQTTIRNIEEGAGVINYNEIRIAFIEY